MELRGKIIFDPENKTNKQLSQSKWKTVVYVDLDSEIDLYYSWFLRKRFNLKLNRSLRGAHITIINDRTEEINIKLYNKLKNQLNGEYISFTYSPDEIRSNGKHWWLKVYSDDVLDFRQALGLSREPYMPLHMTIGYANEKNEEHSEYILRQILKFNL